MTAQEALERQGMTWERLEKLARRALRDRLARNRQYLDEERERRVVDHLVDVGIEWAGRYDPAKANGVSFVSSAYRRMYARVPDPLRAISGDPRRGTPLVEIATESIADAAGIDAETFFQLVEHVQPALTPRAATTLHTIAFDVIVLGYERWKVAERRQVEPTEITDLLEELGWQLRSTIGAAA